MIPQQEPPAGSDFYFDFKIVYSETDEKAPIEALKSIYVKAESIDSSPEICHSSETGNSFNGQDKQLEADLLESDEI
jgi:hypothetical protein